MGGWQYFGKSWNFPSALDQPRGVAGMIMHFPSEGLRTLTSNVHRSTGRRSYLSVANDIVLSLEQLCRVIWSMLDCISHPVGRPTGAVIPAVNQSTGDPEARLPATHILSDLYATCQHVVVLSCVHDTV